MVDFLFTVGQAASVLLLIYGGILVLIPLKRTPDAKRDEMKLMHLRIHA